MSGSRPHGRSVLVVVCLSFLAVLIGVSAVRATAGTMYDNGPPDTSAAGQSASNVVFGTWSCSDSFSPIQTTSLASAQIALWVNSFWSPPETIEWAIGTSPFLYDLATGTASVTNSPTGTAVNGYTLFESTFAISSTRPLLTTKTYWLTLTDAISPPPSYSNVTFWALTSLPPQGSLADYDYYFPPEGYFSCPPNSFQLYDTSTPEPSTLTLLGSALLGLGAVYLRRRMAKV